jgi:hypothetical protein
MKRNADSLLPCDEKGMHLFRTCTKITLGDGKKTKFWSNQWLNVSAPRVIAPLVVRLIRGNDILFCDGLRTDVDCGQNSTKGFAL